MGKSKEEKAAYMREYRKKLHYKTVEAPKQKLRNKLKWKVWQENKRKRQTEEIRKETCQWLYNYWRTLKQEGMTEKQFIIKFDKYLKSLISSQ